MMTNQELFDKVTRHLLTQNAQATRASDGICCYRTDDGKKCAAGSLIDDEHYTFEFEGKLVPSSPELLANSLVGQALVASGVAPEQFWLVLELQLVHDLCAEPKFWPGKLATLADREGLDRCNELKAALKSQGISL
jgi:hypothetical protein